MIPTSFITDCPCGHSHQQIILSRCKTSPKCWEWTGTVDRDGYGVLTHHRRRWSAHRLAFIAFIGPLPGGLVIDHLCRNRACVNPEHMEPVTNAENLRRGVRPTALTVKPRPIRHGTAGAYSNRGCRCDECRAANTSRHQAYVARRRAAGVAVR